MYVLIEHSGTPEHTKTAAYIADFVEAEYGGTAEHVISGEDAEITFYNEELEKLGELLEKIPADDSYIRSVLDSYYERMDDE